MPYRGHFYFAQRGTFLLCPHRKGFSLWQQSENVVFEQSRNVVLTAPSFGDAGRTATDDAGR
jgi:hypothetical protein